ncbi:MAG TPA: hypothetical protein VJ723_12515 [Candidatus Angelobacter sp.]|nr:hypothetical protein [Candidatus Angelobacter sp.]
MYILLAGFVAGTPAGAQTRGVTLTPRSLAGNSAQGQLTVTVTVVASVGLVTGPDGVQRLVVANGSGPLDNVSSLKPLTATPGTQVPAQSADWHRDSRKKTKPGSPGIRQQRR